MPRILIQFAHPAFSKSRIQKALTHRSRELEGITFNDLYEQYPDLYIDVKREQQLLREHDLIIFQHPFYWYSSPPIIKQWLDLVLEYNWAYGPHGNALKGKKVMSVLSCGVGKEGYRASGIHRHPLTDFLLPVSQTASLCHMEYLPPFVVYGTHQLTQEALDEHGRQYAALLRAFAGDEVRPQQYTGLESMNEITL